MNRGRKLSDSDVLYARRVVRNGQYTSLKDLAEKFGCQDGTLWYAIRGKTFRKLNRIEPPIDFALKNPARAKRANTPPPHYIDELLKLRNDDPSAWTFDKLKEHMEATTTFRMSKYHLSRLMKLRDPELRTQRPEVEGVVSYLFKRICVVCDNTFRTKFEDREVCGSKDCRSVIATGVLHGSSQDA